MQISQPRLFDRRATGQSVPSPPLAVAYISSWSFGVCDHEVAPETRSTGRSPRMLVSTNDAFLNWQDEVSIFDLIATGPAASQDDVLHGFSR
eukprot:64852-Hanusia_phi.AAC.7